MEQNEPTAQMLMMQIAEETKRYHEAIKNGKTLVEVKEIKLRIKKLTNQLHELLSKHPLPQA